VFLDTVYALLLCLVLVGFHIPMRSTLYCMFAFSSYLDRCTYVISGAHLQTDVRDGEEDDNTNDYSDNDNQHQQLTDTLPTTVVSPSPNIRQRRRKPCVVSGNAHTIHNWFSLQPAQSTLWLPTLAVVKLKLGLHDVAGLCYRVSTLYARVV